MLTKKRPCTNSSEVLKLGGGVIKSPTQLTETLNCPGRGRGAATTPPLPWTRTWTWTRTSGLHAAHLPGLTVNPEPPLLLGHGVHQELLHQGTQEVQSAGQRVHVARHRVRVHVRFRWNGLCRGEVLRGESSCPVTEVVKVGFNPPAGALGRLSLC